MLRRLFVLVGLALPLAACSQSHRAECFDTFDLGFERGGGMFAISDTAEVTAWRVGFPGRTVGINTDVAALRASFGAPDSVRFFSDVQIGVEGWEDYRPRSWTYPFGSFSIFPDSTAVADWFDVTASGAVIETAEGVLSADTRMEDLGRRYPRSWECRSVVAAHMHYAAQDPPQESLVVFDTTEVLGRRFTLVSAQFVGRGGRLAFLEQWW